MGIEKYNMDSEVAQSLTENHEAQTAAYNKKWTAYLIFCAIIACLSSFQFGYNIGSVNTITPFMVDFFEQNYYKKIFFDKVELFKAGEEKLKNGTAQYEAGKKTYAEGKEYLEAKEKELLAAEHRRENYLDIMFSMDEEKIREAKEFKAKKEVEIREKYNMTVEEFMTIARQKIDAGKIKLAKGRQALTDAKQKIANGTIRLREGAIKIKEGREKLNVVTDIMWAFFNVLFIAGCMTGAFTAKHVTDRFGHKGSILFHYIFTILGALVMIVPFYTSAHASLLKLGRFFYGIQGGMASILVPSYLYEIAPFGLRTQIGTLHSIAIGFGIFTAQILSYSQLLGSASLFHFILVAPIVPAVIGGLLIATVAPDSPRELLDNQDDERAQSSLKRLRNSKNVNGEIQLLYKELDDTSSGDKIRFHELFTNPSLCWPIFISILLQLAQQLSGINAIFFYSRILFETAGVPAEHIQYAVSLTGLVNFLALIVFLPLAHNLSRKKTLSWTLVLMTLDLMCLVLCMKFQPMKCELAYVSVACVLVFLILFAIGLNEMPFMFVDECFERDARSSPLFVCIAINWIGALLVVFDFPMLLKYIQGNVFIISIVFLALTAVLVIAKVPETKGKSASQIQASFNEK